MISWGGLWKGAGPWPIIGLPETARLFRKSHEIPTP